MSTSHLLKKDSILNVDTTLTNTDLSNLSNTGEAHFTNPDLSNLSIKGQAKFDAKANASNTVTTDTAQTITGFKAFNSGSGNNRTNIDIITNDGVADDTNVKWAGSIQFKKGNVNVGYCEAMRDNINSSITQIVAHNSVNGQEVYSSLRSVVTSDGNTFTFAETTPTGATGNEIATAGWVNSKIQLVSGANVDLSNLSAAGQAKFDAKIDREGNYTVVETYRNGNNWYRVWSDGRIEQGGSLHAQAVNKEYTINLLIPFSSVGLSTSIQNLLYNAEPAANNAIWLIGKKQFRYVVGAGAGGFFNWYACGY